MSNQAFYSLLNNGSPIARTHAAVATLDFPSIAAAGTQALTITVPGVSVNDIVVLGLPATVNAGVVFDARVSAADTVTVRALNITAAPIDPASAQYEVVVLKLV
jgi:hypothetical protein